MVLKHNADVLAQKAELIVVERAQILLVQPHPAAAGLDDAADELEHGRLARTGMPGNKNHLALADIEAEVFQRMVAAGIGFGNLFETDHKAWILKAA